MDYKSAGVDIDAGNELVKRISPLCKATTRPGVLSGIGGFGGLFEIPTERFQNPVLVSGTDGVGTKLRLAMQMDKHDTIGIDLVAMCVNDIIVTGAEPLFFLDYYATGKLLVDKATDVVKGIAEGCMQSGAALIGGETAEMPGMYEGEDYDLAGFAVGIVDKHRIITGENIAAGDALIGLKSSGLHSNGYSLARKVFDSSGKSYNDELADGVSFGEALLAPTRIYVRSLLHLIQQLEVKGLAHITGGGLLENIPRVLPANSIAVIDSTSWQPAPLFSWLQQQGNIAQKELYRTFNCGVGMVVCVAKENAEAAIKLLGEQGEQAFLLGHIEQSDQDEPWVDIR